MERSKKPVLAALAQCCCLIPALGIAGRGMTRQQQRTLPDVSLQRVATLHMATAPEPTRRAHDIAELLGCVIRNSSPISGAQRRMEGGTSDRRGQCTPVAAAWFHNGQCRVSHSRQIECSKAQVHAGANLDVPAVPSMCARQLRHLLAAIWQCLRDSHWGLSLRFPLCERGAPRLDGFG